MFTRLRAMAAHADAEDARMREHGYDVLRTGALSSTYKLSPAFLAEMERLAEDERVRQMARRVAELHAIAFPAEHAELQQRIAAQPPAVPAPAPALPLDQLATVLAERMGTPDRLVFERLTIERGAGGRR
jgi:uncharacterized membrane protein YccC